MINYYKKINNLIKYTIIDLSRIIIIMLANKQVLQKIKFLIQHIS